MSELGNSLERMAFVQLVLLFGFLASYVLALGGMLGAPGRWRAAALALALALAFTAATDPWVHGALLMGFVIAGLGLFVALTWLLARLLGPRPDVLPAQSEPQSELPGESQPLPLRHSEPKAPKLAPRARALR